MKIECDKSHHALWRISFRSQNDEDATIKSSSLDELKQILDEAENDSQLRILVLEGEEGRFCRGMDLSTVEKADGSAEAGVKKYASLLSRLRLGKAALIAIVDGPALGGGLGLAAAADTVIATERASFALPELLVGLLPAMVFPLLAERMPTQKVRRMALGGLTLSAQEAYQLGLVDLLAEDALSTEKMLKKEAKQLLRLAPKAVARLREYSGTLNLFAMDKAIEEGAKITVASVNDGDVLEGIRAFNSGETPSWYDRYRVK